MNRRSFIQGLIRVGAFAAFDPHRVVFDMGRGLFLPTVSYIAAGGVIYGVPDRPPWRLVLSPDGMGMWSGRWMRGESEVLIPGAVIE
jgi:hypothetical protein